VIKYCVYFVSEKVVHVSSGLEKELGKNIFYEAMRNRFLAHMEVCYYNDAVSVLSHHL
jgi:hypothetical protein